MYPCVGVLKITAKNFKALSKSEEIETFEIGYQLFLEAADALKGDAGHSEDKRLQVADDQAALFNEANPEDRGVTTWAFTSRKALLSLLGVAHRLFFLPHFVLTWIHQAGQTPDLPTWQYVDQWTLGHFQTMTTLSPLSCPTVLYLNDMSSMSLSGIRWLP